MHSNSLKAYNDIIDGIGGKRREVLDVIIRLGEATRQDIGEDLGWPINAVTGRVTELLELGAIDEVGTDRSSGRPRAILGLSYEASQLDLQF
jgi:predicted ArsR family transcriptional regulator